MVCMAGFVGDNLSRDELLTLVQELLRQNAELQERVKRLEEELAQVRRELAAARKNSSNSSKPPSSDVVKPPPAQRRGRASRRKPGGQPGHPRHERPPFPPEQVDRIRTHTLRACPGCGGRLRKLKGLGHMLQQAELVARPIQVTEHRCEAYCCRSCGQTHQAPLPPAIEAGGLIGPRLTALVAHLKGAAHASYSTICRFFQDVLGLSLSRGYLVKLIRKATRAMNAAYDALRQRLKRESQVNADETGHRENGRRPWTWCFRAKDFTAFRIAASRGSDVLWDTLGSDFAGVLGCDYFSAYRKYMKDCNVRVQFCLAHLIRELKFMMTLPHRPTVIYAECLLSMLRKIFQTIHRRATMSAAAFLRTLERQRGLIVQLATHRVPNTSEAHNLAERFRRHGPAYFTFITQPDLPPTNNVAEQAIRFVVIDRHITQGTRSAAGRAWCERIWTALATCTQQHRSAFEFLYASIHAHFHGQPAPMLVANTP